VPLRWNPSASGALTTTVYKDSLLLLSRARARALERMPTSSRPTTCECGKPVDNRWKTCGQNVDNLHPPGAIHRLSTELSTGYPHFAGMRRASRARALNRLL
jgi:hypothetical protein